MITKGLSVPTVGPSLGDRVLSELSTPAVFSWLVSYECVHYKVMILCYCYYSLFSYLCLYCMNRLCCLIAGIKTNLSHIVVTVRHMYFIKYAPTKFRKCITFRLLV